MQEPTFVAIRLPMSVKSSLPSQALTAPLRLGNCEVINPNNGAENGDDDGHPPRDWYCNHQNNLAPAT